MKGRLEAAQRKYPVVGHGVHTVEHYGEVKGTIQAGAMTYFGFLSVFPIMALAFFAVGWISKLYPEANEHLVDAITTALPGLISTDGTPEPGQTSLAEVQDAAATVGTIGLIGVLYTGLGWLSATREALITTFETPERRQPNFVVGKARDLLSLLLIGATLMLSVSIAGLATAASTTVLDFLELDDQLSWLVKLVGIAVGLAASTVLFFALFRLLADPPVPSRSLWKGAVFGAVGFEALKWASTYLIASTAGSPAFAVFGSALVILVWVNYFSRLVVFAAAWAYQAPAARARRTRGQLEAEQRELETLQLASVQLHEGPASRRLGAGKAFVAGGASMLGLVALLRRRGSADQ